MEVALFGGLQSDRSPSMVNYGQALRSALEAQFTPGNHFQEVRGADISLPCLVARYHRLQAWSKEGLAMQVLYPLQAARAQKQVNHVLDHSYGSLLTTLPPERTVVTCHDLIPLVIPQIFPTLFSQLTGKRWYQRSIRAMARARRIIAISENTRADLIALSGCRPEQTVVIPHGIDGRFRRISNPEQLASTRRHLGLPDGCRFILHVGSTATYKNIPCLLDVLRQVCGRTEESIWLLHVGAAFTRDQVRLIERWGLGDRVWTTDNSPQEDLVALYNLADVLVFPSLYEGLGLPLIEAMACGLPVVASNAASIPEVLGDRRLTFAPGDGAGMAEAVLGILDHPELQQEVVEHGLRRARRFAWTLIAQQVFAVYEEVLRP